MLDLKKAPELCIGERFRVTLEYKTTIPAGMKPVDAFLVVNDGGFPFLLGFKRHSSGIGLVINLYIAPALERDLRDLKSVDLVEVGSDGERTQKEVELLHSLD